MKKCLADSFLISKFVIQWALDGYVVLSIIDKAEMIEQ